MHAEASRGEASRERHDAVAANVSALAGIEARQPPTAPAAPPETLRLAAWSADAIRPGPPTSCGALVPISYCRAKWISAWRGPATRHTTRDLAERLGVGHLYGVEFVELGLGMGRERVDHANETNAMGLHGNAVLSRLPFRDPFPIRLDEGGAWFGLDWHHRRLGGRMALGAVVEMARGPVAVALVHLENRSSPQERRVAMERLLAGLDAVAPRRSTGRRCPTTR